MKNISFSLIFSLANVFFILACSGKMSSPATTEADITLPHEADAITDTEENPEENVAESGLSSDAEANETLLPEAEDLYPEDSAMDEEGEVSDLATDIPDETLDADTALSYPACATYGAVVSGPEIKNEELKEISDIAVSLRNPGILWTHNDSGCAAALYAIDANGTIHATLELDGAVNTDWEDMALVPCATEECFYIADVGDNALVRSDYALFRVFEPDLSTVPDGTVIKTADWERFPIAYSDGVHNTEAFAIHPDGSLYLFTKEIGRTVMYEASSLNEEDATIFSPLGEIPTGLEIPGYPDEAQPSLVTSADIHRNGDRLLLRIYGIYTTANDGIYELRVPAGEPFSSVVSAPMTALPEGADMQGEAVAYDPLVGGYVHTSEFYNKIVDFNPRIHRVPCAN